jgi:hypothetical protein
MRHYKQQQQAPGNQPCVVVNQLRKYNCSEMFARKLRVEYETGGQTLHAPLKWLDSFAMRSFTNDQMFDDTLPIGDGQIEIGARVPLDRLKDAMEDWFRRKGYIAKDSHLNIVELRAGSFSK